jgi:excisionase family DNA binding protein
MESRRGHNEHKSDAPAHPRAHRIADVCALTGLGRTTIYAAIKAGHLPARKYGRSTVVLDEDLAAFLRNLPNARTRG